MADDRESRLITLLQYRNVMLCYYKWKKDKERSRRKPRQYWVREINLDRSQLGEYSNLVKQMITRDPDYFKDNFRMTTHKFFCSHV